MVSASLVVALFTAFWSSPSAQALTPAFVQANSGAAYSGTTDSVGFTKPNTAANLIAVYVIWGNPASTFTLTDTRGNSYVSVGPATKWNNSTWNSQVFYAKNIAAGTNTVQAKFSSAITSYAMVYIHEYSGLDTANPLDATASAIGTVAAMSSGSITTTNANDLIFGAGASTVTMTAPGSGYATRSNGFDNMTEDKQVTATGSYSATATQNGKAWVMQVVAFRASTAVVDTSPPSTPTGLMATPAATQVSLNWTASTDNIGVVGYKVFRNTILVGTATTPTYVDSGLAAGVTFSYTVAAVDAAGNTSPLSSPASATTVVIPDTTAPTTPGALTALAISPTQVNLSWTASTDNVAVTGYLVFRNANQIAVATGPSYIDSNATPSTAYTYAVSAIDAVNNQSPQSTSVGVTTPVLAGLPFPTKVSANNRYLLDQYGNPYLIVGDSPQSLAADLTEAQADLYFADRQAHGINSAWVQVLCNTYTGGRADGSTYDGILPFLTPGDFSTPNPVYFQRLVDMVNIAAVHGITVFLDPVDLYGWLSQLRSNGVTKDYNFGLYLGNLFKTFPNVVWLNGNDFQTWQLASDDADALAIANGIKAAGATQFQTIELTYNNSSSLDDPNWQPIISLNAAYTYYPTYDEVLHAYNQSPTMPTYLIEANYEFDNNTGGPTTTAETLRRQGYWTMLSGATGVFYGSHYTYDSVSWAEEQANLDTVGATQLQYLQTLFTGRAWYNLVPDQGGTFLTAGKGTYDPYGDDVLQSDYATAARSADGSLGLVYVPTARTVTVNLSLLAGTVTAQWFDPTTGVTQAAGGATYAPGSGPQLFTSPGVHADGASDWVLLFTGNSTPDITPPTTPGTPVVSGALTTQVSLSWAASTDNMGVAGYAVYRNGVSVGTTSVASFTDTGVVANTAYTYYVVAYDFSGNLSGPSSPVMLTTPKVSPSVPAFVQVNSAVPPNRSTTVSVQYTSAQTAGDTNIIAIGWNDPTGTIVSVTDTKGNSYQVAAPIARGLSTSQAIYYAKNITAASAKGNTITVTFSTASYYVDLRATEYSGLDRVNPFDVAASAAGSAASASSGSVATTTPNELLFGAGITSGYFSTAGAGYTTRIITYPDSDNVISQNVTSTGSYSAVASQSGDWTMQLATFRAAGQ